MPLLSLLLAIAVSSSTHAQITQHFEMYGAKTEEHIETLHQWGFDQLILEDSHLIAKANEKNMRVVHANWFWPQTTWEEVKARIQTAVSAKSLISINLFDEPIFNGASTHPASYYQSLRKKILTEFPGIPLSLTEYGPRSHWTQSELAYFAEYLKAVDRMRIDPYPVLGKRPVSEVTSWIRGVRNLMSTRPVPLTVILQTWDINSNKPAFPSIAELRVMAYQALLHEAESLSFFDYVPDIWKKVPHFTEDFPILMKELLAFSSKYQKHKVQKLNFAAGVLTAELSLNEKSTTVVVNTTNYSLSGAAPMSVLIKE